MKYIVFKPSETSIKENMYLFPDLDSHDEVYRKLRTFASVLVSAGFVYNDGDNIPYCTGYSSSLSIKSRPDHDTKLLHRLMERM